MLSTHTPSSIQRRRTQHRRQNSTPAAFEAPTVRPLPTNNRQQRHQRSGMSLDLRGLNLATVESFRQDSTVSNTNIGQPQQHYMQVAQPHSHAQPGPQESFLPSSVQQSLPSPRTPQRTHSGPPVQHFSSFPPSPTKAPSEEELQSLHKHIQRVYGFDAPVFINILPTPTATPQKPSQSTSYAPIDHAVLPPNFNDVADINLAPTSSAMTFDFENPEADFGYESSSNYTSDALSPSPLSPLSSPRQKSSQTFLEKIEEDAAHEMNFSQAPSLLPSAMESNVLDSMHMPPIALSNAALPIELELDATIEYTGISPDEVQRYISEQDPTTSKWTCLYPECGKVFGRRENIRSHVQTHLGDRQYRCNGCGKCFVRQHDLKRHAKIHTGNKPYKCPCGAGFARQDALTRHRQRGMCVGAFPDAVRRPAKRGRPKKNRPDMEERVTKANRTRRALASATSSVSAGSPRSDSYSEGSSPPRLHGYDATGLPKEFRDLSSFNEPMSSTADSFSFETAGSPYQHDASTVPGSFACSSSFPSDVTSFNNILQELSQTTQTPPMSPADHKSTHSSYTGEVKPLMGSSTPSQSSIQSNPFSTPPTSPADQKDELEDLFNTMTENGSSQFELEMKAIGDFTSLDTTTCDFLDFNM